MFQFKSSQVEVGSRVYDGMVVVWKADALEVITTKIMSGRGQN